jgi:hypothetical protein
MFSAIATLVFYNKHMNNYTLVAYSLLSICNITFTLKRAHS